ncbi:MAG: hypothetical protein J1E60_07985 [Christensenellaceae bacterium]|nr:hypothetical protein [Christensenellaceae bacterium]
MNHKRIHRIQAALLAAAMLALMGCSNTSMGKQPNDAVTASPTLPVESFSLAPTQDINVQHFDSQQVASSMKVTEYMFDDSFGDKCVCLAIENPTSFDVEIVVSLKSFDEGGNILNAKTSVPDFAASGQTILKSFSLKQPFASMEYEISVAERKLSHCAIAGLSWESTKGASSGAIVSVTNNNSFAAESVSVSTLFFKDGDPVYLYLTQYFMNAAGEIPAGTTWTEEVYCSKDFDSVQVFLQDNCYLYGGLFN